MTRMLLATQMQAKVSLDLDALYDDAATIKHIPARKAVKTFITDVRAEWAAGKLDERDAPQQLGLLLSLFYRAGGKAVQEDAVAKAAVGKTVAQLEAVFKAIALGPQPRCTAWADLAG